MKAEELIKNEIYVGSWGRGRCIFRFECINSGRSIHSSKSIKPVSYINSLDEFDNRITSICDYYNSTNPTCRFREADELEREWLIQCEIAGKNVVKPTEVKNRELSYSLF